MKPNHTAKQCFDCLAVWVVLGLALNGSLVGCAAATSATPAAGAAVPTPPAMQSAPRVFVLNPHTLANNKARLATDKTLAPALEQLVQEANQALKTGSLTVVAKTVAPEGGGKHDYVSLSPYWWPDPSKPDGLPYIQRDGQTNPELYTIPDKMALYSIISTTETLSLAYYFTGDERYAQKSAELLRAFFLDPETRMNPNARHAQTRRGHGLPKGGGIIEFRDFSLLVDSVGLLEGSPAWTAADQQALQEWMNEFLKWLTESSAGQAEARTKNNHSTWYDQLVIALALFTGKTDVARQRLEGCRQSRIALQIEPDGQQPQELARTLALHYSVFNLRGLFRLASMGERAGVDLWNTATSDGRSIRRAVDWLLPYLTGEQKWTYQQIEPMDYSLAYAMLTQAAAAYNEPRYARAAARVATEDLTRSRANLVFPPLGWK